MKVCIIGGGLSGLVAAYRLSDITDITDIVLHEKNSRLGGCLSSSMVHAKPDACIEDFYHHCFSGDKNLLDLMDELNIGSELEWLKGSTGYYVDGVINPLTTPLEIIRYPHLTFMDKARLAWLTLRSKSYDRDVLDEIPACEFIEKNCGTHNYESFFEPLLRSKFGSMRERVSAAWLISRIAIRSDRGPAGERLGYPVSGWHVLIDALESSIREKGCTICREMPAQKVNFNNGRWSVNDSRYDAVISTIRPADLEAIGGPKLPEIPYQGAACMTIALDREVTDGIYWLNMKDDAPYGAVIGHTNFVPVERYGEHIVYLASYFRDSLPENHEEIMLEDFCTRFGVKRDEVHWHHLKVESAAGPVYTTGFRKLIPEYNQQGLYMAGMFSLPNYPERSMEGSVVAGNEVADLVKRDILNV